MLLNNKKNIFIFFLLFIATCVFANDLTIMSFNIQGHAPDSNKHRKENEEWVELIIKIIKKSKAHLILLQEVPLLKKETNSLVEILVNKLNEDSLSNLPYKIVEGIENSTTKKSPAIIKPFIANILKKIKEFFPKNERWKYTTSVEYSISCMDLNNAVLYNSKYLTLEKDLGKDLPFNFYKYEKNQKHDNRRYKFHKNNQQFLAFSNSKQQIFYIANVHFPSPTEKNILLKERRQLEKFFSDYKMKYPIIIAGDFNMGRKELLRSTNFKDAIIDGTTERYANSWGQKTTVTQSVINIELANDYDHFIINKNNFFSLSEQMHHVFSKDKKEDYQKISIGRKKYYKASKYRKEISDHIPIIIKLDF